MFGGYHGYLDAPDDVALFQRLRIIAKWQAESDARQEEEMRQRL